MILSRIHRSAPLLFRFLSILIIVTAAGCGPVNVAQIKEQKNATLLAPAEVLELVDTNTLLLHSPEDTYYFFDESGRVFGRDIFNNKDIGRWDVTEGGELCLRMNSWWFGDLRCFPVYSGGDRYYLVNGKGVIAFRAEQFVGDYKNQYYAVDESRKKSSRRSLRAARADQAEAVELEATPLVDEQKDARQPVIPPVPPISEQELQSTVKWMARDCPGCNLAGSNLRKAELVGAKLQGANLAGSDFGMANLRRADLQGANLEDADLSHANLPGADLRDAVLINADFRGANLIRADLTGARTEGADFKGALLEGTIGLSEDRGQRTEDR